jgi:sugar phosphate permease
MMIPVFLIAAALLIGYVDRGSLSIAAPVVMTEFGLSASQLGLLFSGFFWAYTVGLFAGVPFIDRFRPGYVLAGGFLVWSLATAMTGAVHSFEALLIASYGWRAVFVAIGLISLLWLPLWLRWMPRGPGQIADVGPPPPLARIVRQRAFWGSTLGMFCLAYFLYFTITWLPTYLAEAHSLSTDEMTLAVTLYYLADACGSLATGAITDMQIRRGRAPGLVRKAALAGGCVVAAAGMMMCLVSGAPAYKVWLAVAGLGFGCANSGAWAFIQTLAGPTATGRWTSLTNGFATFAGILASILTGVLVDRTGDFNAALTATAGICLLGALMWTLVVGPFRPVAWRTT